ncbi:AAA domain containing protein [Nitzschia inconspicua]|uniref:AAA domain containing protein n=1 Tax=Nitzschia inconspicua TaxID=303405 RepID=A0A9K3PP08_9STRA|nr:AAA domain containing protein [Nitzschia inconspicua]
MRRVLWDLARTSSSLSRHVPPQGLAYANQRHRLERVCSDVAAARLHSTPARQHSEDHPKSLSSPVPTHLIFGANTDVGKTVLTAGLLQAAATPPESNNDSFSTHYIKPLQCGGSDEGFVLRNASCVTSTKTLFRWETPASPHVAARMENKPVSDEQVMQALHSYLQTIPRKDKYGTVPSKFSSIWIETAGGVLSPSSSSPDNNSTWHSKDSSGSGWVTQGDLYRPLGEKAAVVLVGDGRLGGISVTLCSLEALWRRGYTVAGVLLLRYGEGDYAEDVNQRALQEHITGLAGTDSFHRASPLFQDPERSIVSLPVLPPEPVPLTDWYSSSEVKRTLSSFVHEHLFQHWEGK